MANPERAILLYPSYQETLWSRLCTASTDKTDLWCLSWGQNWFISSFEPKLRDSKVDGSKDPWCKILRFLTNPPETADSLHSYTDRRHQSLHWEFILADLFDRLAVHAHTPFWRKAKRTFLMSSSQYNYWCCPELQRLGKTIFKNRNNTV